MSVRVSIVPDSPNARKEARSGTDVENELSDSEV
jgi:hypothetical protein